MQIIKGGFSFVEVDDNSSFTSPLQIGKLLKAGTSIVPKTLTEEFADNTQRPAAKAVDISIRSADVNAAAGSVYAAMKAAEEARTPQYFRFVKVLSDPLSVEDCEDAWNENVAAGVTSDVDAVNFKAGTKSVLLTIGDVILSGTVIASEVIAKDLSTYKGLTFWIKAQDAYGAGALSLLLDNTALCASPLETLPLPALEAGVWKKCTLIFKDPSALSAVISIGLKADDDIDLGGASTINIDDVRAVTGYVTVINNIIPKINFEQNEAGKHNAIKITGDGFADTEANLLTTNF